MIKIKSLLLCVIFIVTGQFLFAGAKGEEGSKRPLTIYGIKGPSGLWMANIFETPPEIPGMEVRAEALSGADLVAARFLSGEAKAGILPPNLAAKIASSGKNIKTAAITGYGMLSLLSSDTLVNSVEDLRGKQVEIAGAGATPEYVFRRILKSKGIEPETDITLGQALAYPEIAQSLISGRISTALLPEPFATIALEAQNSQVRKIGDIQAEWKAVTGSDYPTTVFVFEGGFAESNQSAVKAILESVKASIALCLSNPIETGALAEKHGMGINAAIAAKAIPRCNFTFIDAENARTPLEDLFRVFLEFAPSSIGGELPGENFYIKLKP